MKLQTQLIGLFLFLGLYTSHAQFGGSFCALVNVDKTSVSFVENGGTDNITLTFLSSGSCAGSAQVSGMPNWINYSFTTGTNLQLNTGVNTGAARSGQFTISYGFSSYTITVSQEAASPPPTPNTNLSYSNNQCGSATITHSGSAPSNITWYWQGKNANGTSTGNIIANVYPANQGSGTYYLRARNDLSGLWSDNSASIYVPIGEIPSIPSAVTTNVQCGQTILTRANPPSGITWYWQSSNSGTSTADTSKNKIMTSGTTYYLRAKNNSYNCWSGARVVNYAVQPSTVYYSDSDGDGFGNPNSSTVSCSQIGGYVTNNNDLDDANALITNIAPQTFYYDADQDGFGDPNVSIIASPGLQPSDYVTDNNDLCPEAAGTVSGCDYTAPVLSDENYVFTRTYQRAMGSSSEILENSDVIEQVGYFDGLGRPKQQIAIKASPDKKDIITHITYDGLGRQNKEWLPYPETSGTVGTYRGDIGLNIQSHYKNNYPNDFTGMTPSNSGIGVNAYSQKEFEASPLNRVLKQAAPGKDWKLGGGHEIKFGFETNTSADQIRLFEVTIAVADNTYTPTLVHAIGTSKEFYGETQLYKTVTKDENWVSGKNHTTEEFKNMQGQVILKRTYADYNGQSEVAHDTYYVYDDYGNLTYVIPPEVDPANGIDATELAELCYQYIYDHKNRLVEKKIPGKGWEYIVYDVLDRPVMTKDPINDWLFTKYDILGRVVYTGTYMGSENRKALQTIFNDKADSLAKNYEEKVTSGSGFQNSYYTNSDFPSANIEILTVNYYDNYSFDKAGAPASITAYGVNNTSNTKTLATGTKVKVLDVSPAKWITTVSYYDEKARPIYVYTKNDYLGTVDIVQSELDFGGKVKKTESSHTKDSYAAIVVADQMLYDHAGRLKKQIQQIDGGSEELIVENTYDALGQLIQKGVGGKVSNSTRLQAIDYKYNIRGWLTGINNVNQSPDSDKLFNFKIDYNTGTGVHLYNGNISATHWRTNNMDTSLKSYTYTYDALNRITNADFDSSNSTQNDWFNVFGISYDKMGNLESLKRHKKGSLNQSVALDYLTYSYNAGNRLMKVEEQIDGASGFEDGTNSGNDYTYDANGNMVSDANKGIASIEYNHLNLPTKVTVTGSNAGTIDYVYDATGTKLRKTVSTGAVTEYAGNYVYSGNTTATSLQFFDHAEGYVNASGSGFDYVYQYKDHLGNVRLSYTEDPSNPGTPTIIEESNYYPFGLKHKGYNTGGDTALGNDTAQKWKYNGTEFEEALDFNMYEMPMRQYDPAIGRWTSIDPVTHHANSTYNGYDNNPVFWADPSEADVIDLGDRVKYTGVDAQNLFKSLQSQFGSNSDSNDDENSGDNQEQNCCDNYEDYFRAKANEAQQVLDRLSNGGLAGLREDVSNVGRLAGIGAMGLSYSHSVWAARNTMTVLGSMRVLSENQVAWNAIGRWIPSSFQNTGLPYLRNFSAVGLRTVGRGAIGLSVGIDFFRFRSGEISGGEFAQNTYWSSFSLFGPLGWTVGGSYYVMGDLLGLKERAQQDFNRFQNLSPDQKREEISRRLNNKRGNINIRNPKF